MSMIAIIAGMTADRVIGNGNSLPWQRVKDDLPNFQRLTNEQVVVMGLNTYQAIGKPLPNRHNIVISNTPVTIEGCEVYTSIPAALEAAASYHKDVFIIGGASIYSQTLPLVDTMYLSFIKQAYPGDKFFPAFNEDEWERVAEQEFEEFTFVTFKRKL